MYSDGLISFDPQCPALFMPSLPDRNGGKI